MRFDCLQSPDFLLFCVEDLFIAVQAAVLFWLLPCYSL